MAPRGPRLVQRQALVGLVAGRDEVGHLGGPADAGQYRYPFGQRGPQPVTHLRAVAASRRAAGCRRCCGQGAAARSGPAESGGGVLERDSSAASGSAPMSACTAITRSRVWGSPSLLAAVAESAEPSSSRTTRSDSTWRSRSALARERKRCRAPRAPSANGECGPLQRCPARHPDRTTSSRPDRTATTMRPVIP